MAFEGRHRFPRTIVLIVVLPLVLFSLGSCSGRGAGETSPNIVLISIDALRADHLSCYGHSRNTSPNIDAFAAKSTLYGRAVAASPWTLPSYASLLTGLYPFEHGAHRFHGYRENAPNSYRLREAHVTLAEALRDEGYCTAAFLANRVMLSRWTRLNQGFEVYFRDDVAAETLNKRIFAWLERRREEPFFLLINYMDTHTPYNARPFPGLLDGPCEAFSWEFYLKVHNEVLAATPPLPRQWLNILVDQYDVSIAHADQAVGQLLQHLKALRLDGRTLIVLTSDHGEYFGEHRLMEHGKDVYEEAVWVPLIVRKPGQTAGEQVDRVVSLTAVPQIVFSQLPQATAARLRKRFPSRADDGAVISEIYFCAQRDLYHPRWGHRFKRIRTAIFDWPYKFIHSTDGAHELYHLEEDPQERNNLAQADEERAAALAERLKAIKAGSETILPGEALAAPSPEEVEQMRALGYL